MKQVWENRYDYVSSAELGIGYTNPNTKMVRVGQVDNLATWATDNGFTYMQIKYLNPWIVGNQLPIGDWNISVFDI